MPIPSGSRNPPSINVNLINLSMLLVSCRSYPGELIILKWMRIEYKIHPLPSVTVSIKLFWLLIMPLLFNFNMNFESKKNDSEKNNIFFSFVLYDMSLSLIYKMKHSSSSVVESWWFDFSFFISLMLILTLRAHNVWVDAYFRHNG